MSLKLNLRNLLFSTALLATLATPVMAADTYKLDPMHTAVVFHVNHFGFSNPSGKFMNVAGTVVLDQQNPAASKVNVTIPIAALDTDVPMLDDKLKSKDFFDAAAYPTATFASTKVDVTGKDTAIVHGMLTLHGVSKPVDLNVRFNKLGENFMKQPTAGFSAVALIKRSDFGINSFLPAVGDDVHLDIESEANL